MAVVISSRFSHYTARFARSKGRRSLEGNMMAADIYIVKLTIYVLAYRNECFENPTRSKKARCLSIFVDGTRFCSIATPASETRRSRWKISYSLSYDSVIGKR